jgi:hypothetical protein
MSGLFDQVVNYSPPLLTSGQVNYDGTWNAATNTPTLVSPPDALSKGDYYVVSAAGTQFSISFAVGDWIISNGTAWEKVDLTDAVSSVFGRTGAVVGDSTDYSAVGITNTAIGAANPSTGAFTSLSSSSTTTLNGTTIPASKTLVVTTDKLSALAATTSAELAGVISDETGSGSLVFANSPTLVTPALGTPSALVGTNITGTAAAFNINGTVGATTPSTVAATSVTALSDSGYQAVIGQLTSGDRVGISGQSSGSGAALVFFDNAQTTFRPAIFDASSHSLKISGVEKASVTSTGLQGAIGATTASTGAFTTVSATTPIAVASGGTGVSTSTGTTNVVLSNSPTLVTPILGTPQSGTLTSCTGLPISTGVSGLGTGIATALAVNVGTAGAPVVNGGALGTPSSGTVTNLTGTASININGTVGATTPSTGAFTGLTASSDITIGTGGTANVSNGLVINSTSASSYGSYISMRAAGVEKGVVSLKKVALGGSSNDLLLYSNSDNVVVYGGGSLSGTFTSTGLAVTGALSATGDVTLAATSNLIANKSVLLSDGTAGTATGAIYFINDTDTGFYRAGGNTLGFMGNGASLGTWSPTGLAVTGALSSTTGANFATSSGNVGIGTASPYGKLDVRSSVAASVSDGIFLGDPTNGFLIGENSAAALQIAVTASGSPTGVRMTISNSGNLGINTPDQFGGGVKVIGILNAQTVPASNPTDGGVLYVESGALKYRGSSGTVTTIANA